MDHIGCVAGHTHIAWLINELYFDTTLICVSVMVVTEMALFDSIVLWFIAKIATVTDCSIPGLAI